MSAWSTHRNGFESGSRWRRKLLIGCAMRPLSASIPVADAELSPLNCWSMADLPSLRINGGGPTTQLAGFEVPEFGRREKSASATRCPLRTYLSE